MVTDLLLRPATTVVATVRDVSHPTAQSLSSLTISPDNSKLIIFPLDVEATDINYTSLQTRLANEHGISRLDIVIANAGASPEFKSILDTSVDAARYCFEVNGAGPLQLFQACWPLLENNINLNSNGEKKKRTKFVHISSTVGSVGCLDEEHYPSTAYGMSKAASNWLAKKIGVEFGDKGLEVGIIHPGYVWFIFQEGSKEGSVSELWLTNLHFQ